MAGMKYYSFCVNLLLFGIGWLVFVCCHWEFGIAGFLKSLDFGFVI
jgi:hypothetical protein